MILDHTNPDSIARCIRSVNHSLTQLRAGLHKCTSYECCEPLAVRLVSGPDGELWFATGSVQYDTVHGVACEAIEINPGTTDAELQNLARDLVESVADQLASD